MTAKIKVLPNQKDETLRKVATADYADNTFIVGLQNIRELYDWIRVTGTDTHAIEYRIDISPGHDGFDDSNPAKDYIWIEKQAATTLTVAATEVGTPLQINEVWAVFARIQVKLTVGTPSFDLFWTGIGTQ